MKRQVKQWQVEPTDNAKEVKQVKQQLVQIIKTEQRLNNVFNKLDLDHNGVLSLFSLFSLFSISKQKF